MISNLADPVLKAPFPYFGGKTLAASLVWEALGDVRNYVEPFAGSLGVLLNRPAPFLGPETVNDLDCHVVNVWRAIRDQPTMLAERCVAMVAEVETEATHAALVDGSARLRDRLGDPDFCDIDFAAWWIKGANEWIGTGWCEGRGPWAWTRDRGWHHRGTGVNRQLPHLGNAGTGVNRQLPHLGNAGTGEYRARVEWVVAWMNALRDRLVSVRIACGDWRRVLGDSVTVKHGCTGIFLDPPYAGTEYVYTESEQSVSASVREWCLARGSDARLRIVLAGRGAEHDALLEHGWTRRDWKTRKGYAKNGEHAAEALWLSPHCQTIANP